MYPGASRPKRNAVGRRLERLVRPRLLGAADRVHGLEQHRFGLRLDEVALALVRRARRSVFRAAPEGVADGGVYDVHGQSDCPAQHGGAKRHPCL
jgi:hypothetical protein